MTNKNTLTDKEIKKSLLLGVKYVIINIMTSFIIVALLFLIAVIIGFESDKGVNFIKGYTLQTIMLPLIVWYYGFTAFNDGYRHSVSEQYNKNKILLAAVPHVIIQLVFVGLAISNNTAPDETNIFLSISSFLLNPYTILFRNVPDLMPEIMVLPCAVAPIAMYIGYNLARFKEIKDHTIKENAKVFRRRLEKEQYEKYDNDKMENK